MATGTLRSHVLLNAQKWEKICFKHHTITGPGSLEKWDKRPRSLYNFKPQHSCVEKCTPTPMAVNLGRRVSGRSWGPPQGSRVQRMRPELDRVHDDAPFVGGIVV